MKKAEIAINNLRIITIIGFNPEERVEKQEVLVNVKFVVDIEEAVQSDSPDSIVDYKLLKKKILSFVEKSSFNLLETLTDKILDLVKEESLVIEASVRVDKPHALRFADSASVTRFYSRD